MHRPIMTRPQWRILAFLFALLLGWSLLPSVSSHSTWAQEGEAVEGEAPAAEGGTATEEGTGEENFLVWIVKTSGWIGAIIFLISFYFVHVVVLSFMTFKLDEAVPPQLVEGVEDALKKRDIVGAYNLVKENETFYGSVMQAGISSLPYGLSHSRESMERAGETSVIEMDRQISMLAVIGSLGPMIGLLGTLKGMIASFSVIARSGTQLKAAEVAGGISEALVLTFEGVALSVPAIYFFALFKNKIAGISSHVMSVTDDQVLRIHAIQQRQRAEKG